MTDITPKERAARIKLDFTIGPETEKRLREAIEHECRNAMQQERRRCFEIVATIHDRSASVCDWFGAGLLEEAAKMIGGHADNDADTLPLAPRARRDGESPVGHFERVPASQDRTRAIVEAADKLAKVTDLIELPDLFIERTDTKQFGNWNPGYGVEATEFKAALAALARALALPESSSDNGGRASGWSSACAFLAAKFDDLATRMPQDDGSAWALRNAAEIARDNARTSPSAPQWQSEPPKESGLWFCRDTSSKVPVIAVASRMEDGRMFFRNLEGERVRDWAPTVEWWPVPISPPPVKP